MDVSLDTSCSDDSGIKKQIKLKKKSLVERELETNLTEKVTSPMIYTDGSPNSTSRYGRARKLKTGTENDSIENLKSPKSSKIIALTKSSPFNGKDVKRESPIKSRIEMIYKENKSLSRFSKNEADDNKKSDKIYVRKDLIQRRDMDYTTATDFKVTPKKSPHVKPSMSTHLNNVLERSSDKYNLPKNAYNYLDTSSVVKAINFNTDTKKKVESAKSLNKSEMFELESKCEYQVGDLTWARIGAHPFWPCIVSRDPYNNIFVKKQGEFLYVFFIYKLQFAIIQRMNIFIYMYKNVCSLLKSILL